MMSSPALAYAQARIQARHGQRPTDEFWRRLAATRDVPHFLQIARTGPLRRWVRHLSPETDIHEIERGLRQDWQQYVVEIAGWQLTVWRGAVSWLATLPYLGAVQHLAKGLGALSWMHNDPALDDLVNVRFAEGEQVSPKHVLAPILEGCIVGLSAPDAWSARWRELWPVSQPREQAALAELERRVRGHVARVGEGSADVSATDLRHELDRQLARALRRYAQTAVAAVAHLGLVAIDLERMRWGLLRRKAFPTLIGVSQWD